MPVTSLIMVRFSIRKKFWKALDLLYQMAVETTGKRRKRWEEMTETTRGKRQKQRTGLWLKIRLEMLSSVVSWFPPRGVVGNDREMMETTGANDGNGEGGNDGNDGETTDWFVA